MNESSLPFVIAFLYFAQKQHCRHILHWFGYELS